MVEYLRNECTDDVVNVSKSRKPYFADLGVPHMAVFAYGLSSLQDSGVGEMESHV